MADDLATIDFEGIDVLSTGGPFFGTGSPPNGDYYTVQDLEEIADNTRRLLSAGELRPPVKLGHSIDQKLAKESGYEDGEMPALGWIDNPRVEGQKLKVDLRKVPQKLGSLLKTGAFRTRSLELRSYMSQTGGGKVGPAIKGLALMGAKAPAVRTLDDIIALYSEEVDEEEVQTREYGEMVWNPELGFRWVANSLASSLNPQSANSTYRVVDVGPTNALVVSYSDNSASSTSTGWVVPFTVTTTGGFDIVQPAPANEWTQAQDRWFEIAREYAEASDALSDPHADTTRGMGDDMNPEPDEQNLEDAPDGGDGDSGDGGDAGTEEEMVSVPKSEYETLKSGAEAGARAERKLAEMERDTFFEEAEHAGKINPADREKWEKRYDENAEMTREIVGDLQPQVVYLNTYGDDSDGRGAEGDAERAMGDAFDDYMGVREEDRVIGGSR